MKSKSGYAAVGMLITLIIIAVLYAIMMPTLKDVNGGGGIFQSPTDVKSVESQVNEKINEIENLREQARKDLETDSQDY